MKMSVVNGDLVVSACPMYKIGRMYDIPEIFKPLTCVYEMKNVFESRISDSEPQQQQQDAMRTTARKISEPSKEENLHKLESRQERLFKQLEQLTTKLQHIKQQMSSAATMSIESNILTERDFDTRIENEVEQRVSDIVVTTLPDYNPITLLIFYHLLSEKLNVRLASHVHSSVLSLPPSNYQTIIRNVLSNGLAEPNLKLTLIWKDVGTDTQFVVSPTKQGAVSGEVNFLRFLASSFVLDLGYDDPVRATQIDQWLDVVHFSLYHGNSKERQAVLRTLNSHLGTERYLVGGRFSLADVAMFGALFQTQVVSTLQSNVKNWVKTCATNSSIAKSLNAMSIN